MTCRTNSFLYRGHRLVYDEYGEGDRVVVYLHGLLIDSVSNRGIAEALAQHGYRVVLLDLLGHGHSDKPEHAAEYRIDGYANQTIALLDELGIHDAVLGGMSLGSNVSLFAATQQPARVRGLILEMPVLEWAVPSAAMLFVPLLLMVHYGEPALDWVSRQIRRVPETRVPLLDTVLHAASLPPPVMASILHGILTGPVCPTQEQRERIQVPTLVLAHRHDLIHPFDDAVGLSDLLPNATLVRARSPIELRVRPDRLTDGIVAFLATVWPERDLEPTRAISC
jgi:pimeloyl-ACP methyl ester carboxylesterase